MKKFLSVILAIALIISTIPFVVSAAESDIVVLYTNDVHCEVDDYAVLAAYRADLIAQGKNVITVDAGDAIQGEVIGSTTKGEAIVDIMNTVGYDYAAPGNHEFDYGMDVFLDLAQNKAEYDYISSNFYYLPSVSPVLAPYAVEDFGSYQVAFVGITTPDTITSSTPEFFKDEGGNYIYGFPTYPEDMTNEELYNNIQKSVDNAIDDGADYVIAVGHIGIIGSNDGWKTTDIIANTVGIDYFIDAHAHETIQGDVYKNENNEDVVVTSTGSKFQNFGMMTITESGTEFKLINPDDVNVETMSADAKSAYNTVKEKIDGYNEDIAYLYDEIGTSEAKLIIYDSDGSRAVRKRETNAGDFVADAYRAVTGADVAIANGGGIRTEIEIGSVSRKNLMDVNAFNNEMCVIEVTGQQILDILEHGARKYPEPFGSFFQVSGMSFEIHTYRESPVITNSLGDFIDVDNTKPRRVQNVFIGDEPIDLNKKYTLTGSSYVLLQGGDGLTMLDDVTIVQQEGLPCDSEMLIKYFTETLNGKITAEKYGNPYGDGRIKIIHTDPDSFGFDYEIKYGETITIHTPNYDSEEYVYIKFVPENDGRFALISESNGEIDPICKLYDIGMNYLDENDDTNGYDFCLNYDFIAGETYYFAVATYSQEAEIDVSLVCAHTYEGGVCKICGEICSHEKSEAKLCFCDCGAVFFGKDIFVNDEIEFNIADYNGDYAYFRFTPEEDGLYIFESVSVSDSSDPICNIYDSALNQFDNSDDVNGYDFLLVTELYQGETYYFEVYNNDDTAVCTLKLNPAVHTTEDGTEHDLEYVEETSSTCTEHGYTLGLYCPVCDEYIYGHQEKELWEHYDDNEDGFCDDCGSEIENSDNNTDCGHICHSENWFLSFVWNIANFFCRIFGIAPVCECGEAHY